MLLFSAAVPDHMRAIKCKPGNGERTWNNSGTATQCTVIPSMSTDIVMHI